MRNQRISVQFNLPRVVVVKRQESYCPWTGFELGPTASHGRTASFFSPMDSNNEKKKKTDLFDLLLRFATNIIGKQ